MTILPIIFIIGYKLNCKEDRKTLLWIASEKSLAREAKAPLPAFCVNGSLMDCGIAAEQGRYLDRAIPA